MLNTNINLKNQTVIITGASRGIGAAAAERLAAAGAKVALLARTTTEIDALAKTLGENALALRCDVSDPEAVDAAFSKTHSHFKSVDILVNNAGTIDPIARIADADPLQWSKVIDINLKGAFFCMRAAIPLMLKKGGRIINISSGAATSALEGWSHYCSSKAALLSLTRCVHKEYGQQGISCVGLSPGTVATQMQRAIAASQINPVSQIDWSRHISPVDVAEAITWLCGDDGRQHVGADFSLKNDEGRKAVGLSSRVTN